ncbi:MAG: hypothetical protein Q7J54_06150 [Candidatus Woesearchaeota archaeon]|nr:hypothetical protein [Candidatus Woesearchaeota archaeon]
MIKALVTLGHHYGELDWGRFVMDEYIKRNLKGNRSIDFYEIQNSNVKTGIWCNKSWREVKRKVKEEELLIDIHCGFIDHTSDKLSHLSKEYHGVEDHLVERVKCSDHVEASKWNPKDGRNIGIPYTLIDAFFFKNGLYMGRGLNNTDYSELIKIVSEEDRQKLLGETLTLINKIYDTHQN